MLRVLYWIGSVNEIIGFPRHLSQHVGGFVISSGPLYELVPVENASMASSSKLANRDSSTCDDLEQALIGNIVGAIDTTGEPESPIFNFPGQSAVTQGSLLIPVSAESHSVKLDSSGDVSEFGRLRAVTAFLQDKDADIELQLAEKSFELDVKSQTIDKQQEQQTKAQRERTGLLSSGEFVHMLCESPDPSEKVYEDDEDFGDDLELCEIFTRLEELGYKGKDLDYMWSELTRQYDAGRVFRSVLCIDEAVEELLLQSKCSDSPIASPTSNFTVESESADKETLLEEDFETQEFSEDAYKQSHEAIPLRDKCSFITVQMCFLSKFSVRGSTTPVRATHLLNLSIRGSEKSVRSTSK